MHMINYTSGNCAYVADNLRVTQQYNKGFNFSLVANGLLWHAVNQARKERIANGQGVFEIVWMPSHRTFEYCSNLNYPPIYWYANQLADKLASQAAVRYAISSGEYHDIIKQASLCNDILRRLVGIAVAIAPQASTCANRDHVTVSSILESRRLRRLLTGPVNLGMPLIAT